MTIRLRKQNKIWPASGIAFLLLLSACAGPRNSSTGLSFKKHQKFESAFYAAMTYSIQEDFENAAKYYELAVKIHPKSHASYYELSRVYERMDNPAKAASYALEAVELSPEFNYWYSAHLANLYLQLGRYTSCVEVVEKMIEAEPFRNELYLFAAEQYIRLDRINAALKILERLEDLHGLSEQSTRLKRYVFYLKNNDEAAIRVVQNLCAAFPSNENYKILLAETYIYVQQYEKAIETLQGLDKEDEESGQAWLILAELYARQGDRLKAFECMKISFAFGSLSIQNKLVTFSSYFLRIRESDSARAEAFELAAILHKTHEGEFEPLMLYGDLYRVLDSFELSRNYFLRALEVKPADFNAWNKLLMVDSRMKAAQHQVDDASEALLYFPNVPSLYLALAYGYYDLEMYDEALTATVNGLDIALNSLDIMELWACKAAIYDKLGDYEQSDKCYEFALSQDEQDVTILNNYAYALADANRKLDYATTLIDKALISAPDNPYYLDTKAWIEYRKGNYEEAIKYLKKAISIDSNSSEYYEHLAEIYYAKGDLELARENIKIAIAKGCNNTELIDKILPKS